MEQYSLNFLGLVQNIFIMFFKCLYEWFSQEPLKKASDTLKHETEITIGDWDTDRVSVAQVWQFGKFELFIGRLRRIDTPVFYSAMENLGILIKLSALIGKKFC